MQSNCVIVDHPSYVNGALEMTFPLILIELKFQSLQVLILGRVLKPFEILW